MHSRTGNSVQVPCGSISNWESQSPTEYLAGDGDIYWNPPPRSPQSFWGKVGAHLISPVTNTWAASLTSWGAAVKDPAQQTVCFSDWGRETFFCRLGLKEDTPLNAESWLHCEGWVILRIGYFFLKSLLFFIRKEATTSCVLWGKDVLESEQSLVAWRSVPSK